MKTILILSMFVGSQFLITCNKKKDMEPIDNNTPSSSNLRIEIINDIIEQQPVVIIGSVSKRFIVSFINKLDGNSLLFEAVQDSLPIIMKDSEGNFWDITGEAIAGPKKGMKLQTTRSFMGYWFSWGAFFPGVEIYKNTQASTVGDRPYLDGDWLVPSKEVFSGGPGKDGIPALSNPEQTIPANADYLQGRDLILGYKNGDDIRAYPHSILDWHEIINDDVNGEKIVITYCPLTGTGIGWMQDISTGESSYGVSGLLYNSNLIPYDRKTDSHWSQMRLDCINGPRKGETIKTIQLIETTWSIWSAMYPKTMVVSANTGYQRNYGEYPYGDYKTSDGLLFPVSIEDNRLKKKEVVHGIVVNDKAKVYRFSHFN